jgi:hypothetical protein
MKKLITLWNRPWQSTFPPTRTADCLAHHFLGWNQAHSIVHQGKCGNGLLVANSTRVALPGLPGDCLLAKISYVYIDGIYIYS